MAILLTKAQRIINDVSVELAPDEANKYTVLDMIKIDQLSDFTVMCINAYGSEEKLTEANKVGDITIQMLMKKNLINKNAQQSFVDIMLSAALLHNLFYDGEDLTTLFKARQILDPIAEEQNIPQEVRNALYQTIEAQLGEATPVPLCKPAPNSPTELFSWAVWFAKEYQPQV